ncbi:hypothetical protein NQ315_012840 [Exocentrus adspersus]|uniref:Retrotransposon gag domain-containing protein n=1 Tax=Exocentrus adspersus TaxID=1586481 RepID=A0AAV8VD19_9CUCU|nr:hypothetical protein NQ315_012840 [Exocentrus adspersus]
MTTPGGAKTPTDPKPDPAAVDLGDLRLSWIYKLRKDEIDAELDKFRLDLTGTVEEKKKRLVRFIREGCTSPRPGRQTEHLQFPVPPPLPTTGNQIPSVQQPSLTAPPATTVPPFPGAVSTFTVSTVCERVRKWNLRFNGKTDAVEFLEKLCEFQEHSGISTTALLPTLYEIFQGNALAWYRNNRELWSCWEDFVTDFKQFYLPVDYESFLEEQIYHRRQQPGESGRDYLVALQTLLRRHGGFTPEKALYRLHGNLRPEYKEYIRLSDVQGTRDLVRRIEEYETIQEEKSRSKARPPTAAPQLYSPSTGNRSSATNWTIPKARPGTDNRPTTTDRPVQPVTVEIRTRPQLDPPPPVRIPGPRAETPHRPAPASTEIRFAGAVEMEDISAASVKHRPDFSAHDRNCAVRPVPYRPVEILETVITPEHDNRPHVPVRIRNQTFLALVDTGSARSYIGNRVHRHCDQLGVPNQAATAPNIQLANGKVATVVRAYHLEFYVAAKRFEEWLDYLPDLSCDLVLGMDILSQHDFVISPAAATVRLDNTVVSTRSPPPPNPLGTMAPHISGQEESQRKEFLYTDVPSFQDIRDNSDLVQHNSYLKACEPAQQKYRPPHLRKLAITNQKKVDLPSLHSSEDEDPAARALEEASREQKNTPPAPRTVPPEPRTASPPAAVTENPAAHDRKPDVPNPSRIILALPDEPDLGIRLLGPPPTAAPASGSTAPDTDCQIYLPVDRWALCWSLAYTLGVARRHKQLLAGNQTQQTCRPRAPAQRIRLSPKERRLRPNQLRSLRPKPRYTLGIARQKSQLLTSHYTEQTCLQPDQEPTPNQQVHSGPVHSDAPPY